ncbi:hypothetical protein IMZ48_30350 [Candidatus Bathyarchaeota archaeon]|nr:hypothetical protein [Candidatus Bathyarchaeota archaeon]
MCPVRFSFSIQIINANCPMTDLDVSIDGQTWELIKYNYFKKENKFGFTGNSH